LINLVSQAVAAFKRHDYSEVVLLLDHAFAYIKAIDYTEIDEPIFNALYDSFEMLSLVGELAVFEKSSFFNQTQCNFKAALDAFTAPKGGTLGQLKQAIPDFLLLLNGMAVGVNYLQYQKIRIEAFPPTVSFEITEDGYIRLYAWDGESEHKIASIEALKAEFEALFEKEKQSEGYFLEMAEKLYKETQYQDCLQLLEDAMLQHETLKGDCFLLKGKVFFQLKQYAEAVDAFMKARVLGIQKYRISELGKEACSHLIRTVETREERNEWSKLRADFF
jgi:tetratricopeptide (TPR) repeat protein